MKGAKNGCPPNALNYTKAMQSLRDVEQEAMKLPEADRAALASRLLNSLPAVLYDEDEGVAEALRRNAELERDPTAALSLDQLRRAVKR